MKLTKLEKNIKTGIILITIGFAIGMMEITIFKRLMRESEMRIWLKLLATLLIITGLITTIININKAK